MTVLPYDTVVSRRWVLGGVAVSTTQICSAAVTGALAYGAATYGLRGPTMEEPPAAKTNAGPADPGRYPAPVTTFTMGYNVRSANYYTPIPLLSNWGKYVSIKDQAPGATPKSIYIPYAGITGTHIITTDVPTTLKSHHATVRINSTGGTTHRLTISADATDTDGRYLEWTGPTMPKRFRIELPAETPKVSPRWVAGLRGRYLRNLDMIAQNNVPVTGRASRALVTDDLYEKDGTLFYPYQDIADGISAAAAANPGFGYWNILEVDRTDAEIRAQAIYERDVIPSTSPITLQFGNETEWNVQFKGVLRLYADGVRNGWYGAHVTPTTPHPPITVTFAGEGDSTNTASPAMPAGGYVLFNLYGVGYAIYRARQAVPAGTTIGENEHWTRDNDKDPRTAGTRWHVVRFKQMLTIYREVFGEERFEAQIVPVVMGQAVIGELHDQLTIFRTFDPDFWAMIKGCGYAFYFGNQEKLDLSSVTPALLEQSFRAEMPRVVGWLRQMVLDNRRMGKLSYLYEGMTHPDFGAYNGNALYRNAWEALFASDLGRVLMADLAHRVKSTVGAGVACGYDLLAGRPWSLMKTWADTQNKRLLGWTEGLADGYVPSDGWTPAVPAPPSPLLSLTLPTVTGIKDYLTGN